MKGEAGPRSLGRLGGLLAAGAVITSLALTAFRLRFCVDVTDEAYYAALAYKFAVGMRPIVDEFGPHQFAAILVSPFVWLWLHAGAGLPHLVIALRVLFMVATVITGVFAFEFLRRVVDWRIALVSIAAAIAIVPYQIPAPSYDTLPALFVSIGVSLAGIAIIEDWSSWVFALPGLLFGLAGVAYPTLALLGFVAASLVWWLTRSPCSAAALAVGAAGTAIGFLLFLHVDRSALANFLAYNGFLSKQLGWLSGPQKFGVIAVSAISNMYRNPTAWILAAIVALRAMRQPVPAVLDVALPASVVILLRISHVGLTYENTLIMAILILVAACAASAPRALGSACRRVLVLALGVGVSMGLIMAYTSNIVFLAAGYGALAVAAPALAMLLEDARLALRPRCGGETAMAIALLAGVFVVCGLVATDYVTSYRDSAPVYVDAQAPGPFAGLQTTPERASYLAEMSGDLSSLAHKNDRLFAYDMTPEVYLLSPARPEAPFLWTTQDDGEDEPRAALLLRWLDSPLHRPAIVVIDATAWANRAHKPRDYLLEYFASRYYVALSRADYVILSRRGRG